MSLHAKVDGAWVEITDGGGGPSGIPWAKVSGGTVTTVNNPDGSVDEVHTFTADGTLTVDEPGFIRAFMIGGGSGPFASAGGTGGRDMSGIYAVPAGAVPVVVGLGNQHVGSPSSVGSIVTGSSSLGFNPDHAIGAGFTVAERWRGVSSDITGASVEYGRGNSAAPRVNRGDGGAANVAGSNGIVIVRVQVSPAPPLPVTQEGWARVTGGTVTEYAKPDGSVMEVHTFTADGSLTVDTPGYADVLLVSGGYGAGNVPQGGDLRDGLRTLPAGAHAVQVGVAGDRSDATRSILGTLLYTHVSVTGQTGGADNVGAAGTNANRPLGYTSGITGSAVEYGRADGTGYGAANRPGVVIVAVQKSAPTASGIVATGGTVTEYTGDGVNGVSGQRYRVHQFFSSGDLVVAQGGKARVLLVGGASSQGNGDGGQVMEIDLDLSAGTLPVVVGPTGSPGGALRTYIGSGEIGVTGALANLTFGGGVRLPSAVSGREGVPTRITGALVLHGGWTAANSSALSKGVGSMNGVGTNDQDTVGRGTVIVRYEVA